MLIRFFEYSSFPKPILELEEDDAGVIGVVGVVPLLPAPWLLLLLCANTTL